MMRADINWEHVRNRLRASDSALQEALAESPERIEAAYHQRALRLAKGQTERRPVSAGLPVIVFRLGQERYAVELKEVAEVVPFTRCTPVPGSSPEFLGVINLRGELRAVLDLGRLLVSSESGSESGFVLVLRGPGQGIGLKVDLIEELREIRREELTLPTQGNCLKGLVGGTLMVLDVEKVLAQVFSKEESI